MKTLLPSSARSPRGAALIIVLGAIVLLVSLVVAFMISAKNELSATTEFVAGQEAAALVETATGLVMAQLRESTLAGIDAQGRGTHSWASQPGAIRVWNNAGQPASPYLYKLYSAARMKEDGMDFLSGEIPDGWRDEPDLFTDLNEPVSRNGNWRYPILNPAALGRVEGFSSNQADDTAVPWDTRTSMAVRWLYVSPDGSLQNSLQPDSVARIAFWTDDESSKVNINTASANADQSTLVSSGAGMPGNINRLLYSFWTVPHTHFMQDYNFGRGNPSQDEFQRYAAHPASVNLLAILVGPAFEGLSDTQKLETLEATFDLFPRYRWGGSANNRFNHTQANLRTDIAGANQKQERLYASVDEFGFAEGMQGTMRIRNSLPAAGPSLEDEARLDLWRFFLTATSRAPDTNLFGQPRVGLWPISGRDDALHRTTQDNLIAFCSTVGTREYYFQRLYPFSQTADWTEFPRNREIFEFLRRSTSTSIPGFGGNFVQKYDQTNGGVAGERDQILTAMFDTIRIANLNETFAGRPADFRSYTPDCQPGETQNVTSTRFPDPSGTAGGMAGAGTVFPILTPYGRGAGRVPVISELILYLIQRGVEEEVDNGSGTMVPTGNILSTNTVQSAFFIETFTPTLGYMPWTPRNFQANLTSSVQVNSVEVFPGALSGFTSTVMNRHTEATSRQPVGGTNGIWDLGVQMLNMTSANMRLVDGNVEFGRTFAQAIPAPDPSIEVGDGSTNIELAMLDTQNNPLVYQSYSFNFPSVSLPRPNPVLPTVNPNNNVPRPGGDWHVRNIANTHMRALPEDVIRSLVPRDGDYRIMAYLQNVPSQFFRPHPDFNTAKRFAHSVRFRRNMGWMGDPANIDDGTRNGSFVGLPYHRSTTSNDRVIETLAPDVPPDINDLVAMGWEGDWNNGVGSFPDGAYLPKPDEGLSRLGGNPNYFHEYGWSQAEGFYSPTQAMPSAMVFGSIPTAVRRTFIAYSNNNFEQGRPWRTLLFCPNPDFEISGPGGQHYGATDPPDYLLADLFNMPVVEPYAISEPLSTAGRINMNYQILPFTNIKRSTGLHALFAGQRVSAIPNTVSTIVNLGTSQNNATRIHHEINIAQTLRQFESRFAAGDLFRSATEICSLFLVPAGQTLEGIRSWWGARRMTGDNLREKPYETTYPLLTTKSNTYTVHVRAQTLAPGTNNVTGEYRGSVTLERFIDPADERIGTEIDPDTQSLEPLYRFRIIENKRFAP